MPLYIIIIFFKTQQNLEDLGDKVPYPGVLPVYNINRKSFNRAVDLLQIITHNNITGYKTVRTLVLDDNTTKKIAQYFSTIEDLKEIHELIYTLNYLDAPPVLLSASLKEYIRRVKEGNPAIIEQQISDIEQTAVPLPSELQIFIYKECVNPVIEYIQALPIIYDVHEDKEWVIDVPGAQGKKINFQHQSLDHTTTFHAQKNLLAAVGYLEKIPVAGSSRLFVFDIVKKRVQHIDTTHVINNNAARQSTHFSYNGRYIASRAPDGIFIHELAKTLDEPIKTIHKFEKPEPNCCAFSIDDQYLFAGYDGSLCIYNIRTGALEVEDTEKRAARNIICHPTDPTTIVFATSLSIKQVKLLLEPTISYDPIVINPFTSSFIIQAINFTPDGKNLVWASTNDNDLRCQRRSIADISNTTIQAVTIPLKEILRKEKGYDWASQKFYDFATLKLQNSHQPQLIEVCWRNRNDPWNPSLPDPMLHSIPFVIRFDTQEKPYQYLPPGEGHSALHTNALAHFIPFNEQASLYFTHFLKLTTYKDLSTNYHRKHLNNCQNPLAFFTHDGAQCFTFNCSNPAGENTIYFFNLYRPHWPKLFPLLDDSKNFSLSDMHRIYQACNTLKQNNPEGIAALKKLADVMPPAIQSTMQQCIAGLSIAEGIKHKVKQIPHTALASIKGLGSYFKKSENQPSEPATPAPQTPVIVPIGEKEVEGEVVQHPEEAEGAQQPGQQAPQIIPQEQPQAQPSTTLIGQGLRMIRSLISMPVQLIKRIGGIITSLVSILHF